jgi:hypothetical protein
VIWGGDDDALDVFVLIHFPEVTLALGIRIANVCQALLHSWFVDIAQPKHLDIIEFFEICNVLLAYQSKPDDPNADPIVGAKHTDIRRGSHGRRACSSQKLPPRGLPGFDRAIETLSCSILHSPILS